MSTWVTQQAAADVDLESIAANHNTLKINDVNEANDAKIAGHFINTSTNVSARGLKVTGKTELNGEIYTVDSFTFNGQEAHFQADLFAESLFHAEGTATFGSGVTVESYANIQGALKVGPAGASGEIDSGGSAGTPRSLKIGTNNVTDDVTIGNSIGEVYLDGTEVVLPGSRKLRINEGSIEAWAGGVDLNVRIGITNDTDDVVLSHQNAVTHVQGQLQVDQQGNFGPAAAAGQIDSGGSGVSPQDLAIGGGTGTKDLTLSRTGQTTETKGNLRVNKNELIMDNSSGLSSGSGFKFNPTGGATGGTSMDVYIAGSKVGYWDSTGWH